MLSYYDISHISSYLLWTGRRQIFGSNIHDLSALSIGLITTLASSGNAYVGQYIQYLYKYKYFIIYLSYEGCKW